jgi:hypothetical protein
MKLITCISENARTHIGTVYGKKPKYATGEYA